MRIYAKCILLFVCLHSARPFLERHFIELESSGLNFLSPSKILHSPVWLFHVVCNYLIPLVSWGKGGLLIWQYFSRKVLSYFQGLAIDQIHACNRKAQIYFRFLWANIFYLRITSNLFVIEIINICLYCLVNKSLICSLFNVHMHLGNYVRCYQADCREYTDYK